MRNTAKFTAARGTGQGYMGTLTSHGSSCRSFLCGWKVETKLEIKILSELTLYSGQDLKFIILVRKLSKIKSILILGGKQVRVRVKTLVILRVCTCASNETNKK